MQGRVQGCKIKVQDEMYYDPQVVLGSGPLSTVYWGYDYKHKRQIAVKMICLNFHKMNNDIVRCLNRQAEIPRRIAHRNILQILSQPIYKPGIHGGANSILLVSEYCSKSSLQSLMESRRLTPAEIIDFTGQMAHAVYQMHTNHCIHRDLKPQNVFITDNNCIKIGDFGISKIWIPTQFHTMLPRYTPLYRAPQTLRQDYIKGPKDSYIYTEKVDMWALGCIIYEMVAGTPLLQRYFKEGRQHDINNFKFDSSTLPESTHQIIRHILPQLLTINPTDRLSSASLLEYLQQKRWRECLNKLDKSYRSITTDDLAQQKQVPRYTVQQIFDNICQFWNCYFDLIEYLLNNLQEIQGLLDPSDALSFDVLGMMLFFCYIQQLLKAQQNLYPSTIIMDNQQVLIPKNMSQKEYETISIKKRVICNQIKQKLNLQLSKIRYFIERFRQKLNADEGDNYTKFRLNLKYQQFLNLINSVNSPEQLVDSIQGKQCHTWFCSYLNQIPHNISSMSKESAIWLYHALYYRNIGVVLPESSYLKSTQQRLQISRMKDVVELQVKNILK